MSEEVEDEWREPGPHGIELTVEESVALWEFFQNASSPYWEDQRLTAIAEKAKSFYKYGPWDTEDSS